MIVYRLVSPSGKSYIGVANDLMGRFAAHKKSSYPVGEMIRKYGSDNIRKEVLLEGEPEYCYFMEIRLIESFGTLSPNGYNLTPGGQGIRKHLPEVRAKMSASIRRTFSDPEKKARQSELAKNQWSDPIAREAVKQANLKTWSNPEKLAEHSERMQKALNSPKARANLSEANRKSWADPQTRANRLAGLRAAGERRRLQTAAKPKPEKVKKPRAPMTEEHKQKLREAAKGRTGGGRKPGFKMTPEQVERIRQANTGRCPGPETREKMRAARKLWWERKREQ